MLLNAQTQIHFPKRRTLANVACAAAHLEGLYRKDEGRPEGKAERRGQHWQSEWSPPRRLELSGYQTELLGAFRVFENALALYRSPFER